MRTLCGTILAAAVFAALVASPAAKGQPDADAKQVVISPHPKWTQTKKTTALTFAPDRTTPVQRGEFKVDLVLIAFPDCEMPESAEAVRAALNSVSGSYTLADYYKEYSQGITWPVLEAYPDIYLAPKPLGYYCRYDSGSNLIGYGKDGMARADKLMDDALRFVTGKRRLKKQGVYTCYVFCRELSQDEEIIERVVRPLYPPKPSREEAWDGKKDKLEKYKPVIRWADPLWPTSRPKVQYPGSGKTLVHELGHCLGAPDFYHASEEYDGLEGAPCLPWDYGPTGPGYCRYIHYAFVPAAAYPKVLKPGRYKLAPRSAKFPMGKESEGLPPLGIFVPSSHPNYLFCIEYCHDEKPPIGHPSAEGLLVHVINVTMASSKAGGSPDLCYTYRSGDPDHKALEEGAAYLCPGDRFDATSDPAAILPNLMPAGIAISDISTDDAAGTCDFKLDIVPSKASKSQLDAALLPRTEVLKIDGLMPTSFHVGMNVKYRGEPFLSEYGICFGTRKNPTEKTGTLFPLFHRDRYDARITGLKPGATYFVRSYARSARGISYGDNELEATLPVGKPGPESPTLFSPSDALLSNRYYQRFYFGHDKKNVIRSANPVFAFMALANYYRAVPGQTSKKASADMPKMALVHCSPTDSRPKFRLAETEKLYDLIDRLVTEAGLMQSDFVIEEEDEEGDGKGKKKRKKNRGGGAASDYGKNAEWVAKCAAALKVKNPKTVFFPAKTEEEVLKRKDLIREWLLDSKPVMLVRQNKPLDDELSERWPLDIAFIDGFGDDDGTFHFVFPGGRDGGKKFTYGERYARPADVLTRTTDAMLIFYRP